ncbi:MAG: hypothetical protein B6I28_05910 [Fusobacteriia bacterium 4572_132]|nr:MAG: hypothetical protein B6I28_05910 [Fusobacteriia bacterium 4572_132]
MKNTINYRFNLPELIDAAFIIKYNENIVMIDDLLKRWKDTINIEIENITGNMIEDINDEINIIEKNVYQNKTANEMLSQNVTQLYILVNNDDDYLFHYFEQRFTNIDTQIGSFEMNYETISNQYNSTLIQVNDVEDSMNELMIENQEFENDLNSINGTVNTLDTNISDITNLLEILRVKLRDFVNNNSNENLNANISFNDVLDKFLLIYREV